MRSLRTVFGTLLCALVLAGGARAADPPPPDTTPPTEPDIMLNDEFLWQYGWSTGMWRTDWLPVAVLENNVYTSPGWFKASSSDPGTGVVLAEADSAQKAMRGYVEGSGLGFVTLRVPVKFEEPGDVVRDAYWYPLTLNSTGDNLETAAQK